MHPLRYVTWIAFHVPRRGNKPPSPGILYLSKWHGMSVNVCNSSLLPTNHVLDLIRSYWPNNYSSLRINSCLAHFYFKSIVITVQYTVPHEPPVIHTKSHNFKVASRFWISQYQAVHMHVTCFPGLTSYKTQHWVNGLIWPPVPKNLN